MRTISNFRCNHIDCKQNARSAQVTEKAGDADLPGVLSAEGALVRHLAEAPAKDQPIDQIVGRDQNQPQPRRAEDQYPYGQKNIV